MVLAGWVTPNRHLRTCLYTPASPEYLLVLLMLCLSLPIFCLSSLEIRFLPNCFFFFGVTQMLSGVFNNRLLPVLKGKTNMTGGQNNSYNLCKKGINIQ